jgi:general secretion pathway protein I
MRVRADQQSSIRGFTLLEVLVGLLVLALALLALTRTAATQVQAFSDLRERTLAGWLAADVLAETRLASPFPATGKSDGKRKFAGRDWRWQLNVEATGVATIRRLDVRISEAVDNATPLVELVGFSGQDLQP